MAVLLSPVGGVAAQFFTNAGVPLSGGKFYTYAAGTSTPQATYTTGAGNIQHSNPIVLDAAGRVPTGEIWLTDGLSYKFVLKDANDVLIATYDNIVGINSNFVNFVNQQEIQTATAGQTVFTLTTMEYQPGTGNLSVFVDGVNQYGPGAQYAYTETDSNTVTFVSGLHVGASVKFTTTEIQNSGIGDASQITYTYPAVDAVQESVEDRLAQYVSVKDFGAVGDGVTDDTTAFVNALGAFVSTGMSVYVPYGTYLITDSLDIPRNCGLVFAAGTIINFNGTSAYVIRVNRNSTIEGNNSQINITNAAFNGDVISLFGSENYNADTPTLVKDLNVKGLSEGWANGTGLKLTATNAGERITWVRFVDVTISNLNRGIYIDVGNSGTVGNVSTYHFVTANTFDKITIWHCNYSIAIQSLAGVPAECSGNYFTNVLMQPDDLPVYVSGGSRNVFDMFIWDWNTNPVIEFVNGAVFNQVKSNIQTTRITGASAQQCYDFTGGMQGQQIINNDTLAIIGDVASNYNLQLEQPASASALHVNFVNGGSGIGYISSSPTLVTYATSSDYRLKENIKPMQNALERNSLLKPCVGTWKTDGSPFEGFLAHELKEVFNHAATGKKDAVDEDGKPIYQGVGTGPLDAHFAACIEELKAEIAALKAK